MQLWLTVRKIKNVQKGATKLVNSSSSVLHGAFEELEIINFGFQDDQRGHNSGV